MSYIFDSRGFLGTECLNFLNKATPLFIIENFPFKCTWKFNLESNTRPRCFLRFRTTNIFSIKNERRMNDLRLFP